MRFFLLFIITVSCFSSCTNPDVQIGETPPVADTTLSVVLADIHLAEGFYQNSFLLEDSIAISSDSLTDIILRQHNISNDDFVASMHYYTQRPPEMKKIYEKVVEILSAKEAHFKAANPAPSLPDSTHR